MIFGIRFKLIALLLVAGVFPLLLTLAVMVVGVGHIRQETVGQGLQSVAAAQAARLETGLRDEAEKSHLVAEEKPITDMLTQHAPPPKSPAELARLDAEWPELPPSSPEKAAVLNNPAAELLRHIQREDPACRDILVTDTAGQLVAATERSNDYYQADELWWQQAYNMGRGKVYVSPVQFDEDTGTWGASMSQPAYAEQGGAKRIVGIIKTVVELQGWASQYQTVASRSQAEAMLVNAGGQVIYPPPTSGHQQQIPGWSAFVAKEPEGAWRIAGGHLQAFAPIDLKGNMAGLRVVSPRWYLTMQAPAHLMMRSLYDLSLYIMAGGLAFITATFLAGMYMADRGIIHPIQRIRRVAERVTQGDLSQRIIVPDSRLKSGDEIRELTRDLNQMFAAMESSHAALTAANEMKSRFIRIAGHELRTPVAYIVGMASLLAKNEAADPVVRSALEKLSARARRLEQIITTMFKLLPDLPWTALLHYSHFDVHDLVEEVVREIRPFAEQRGQRIMAEGPLAPIAIHADRDKLHDALENLLSNGVKFTPDGGEVCVMVRPEIGGRVAIAVHDQGCGISPEELPHLFEPFWGGTDVMKHSTGDYGYQKRGAGLGLAIARHFVRLHGGDLHVSCGPEGSTFTIVIPINQPLDEANPAPPAVDAFVPVTIPGREENPYDR